MSGFDPKRTFSGLCGSVGVSGKSGVSARLILVRLKVIEGKRFTYRRTSFRANIAGERLNVIVPEAERVAGGVYTPGARLSSPWRSSRNG